MALPLFGQTQVIESTKNSTKTLLDSAGVFTGTIEPVSTYNTVMPTVLSDRAGTLVVRFYTKKTNGQYAILKSRTFSYAGGSSASTYTVPIEGPFLQVVYTNTTVDQTSFYLSTMLHVGQPLNLDSSGGLVISGSTSNGALETTQLQVLSELQNRTNLGGLQTYSSRRGDFTVTPRAAGKSVTITGASFTISANAVVYASKRTSGGVWSVIPISTVTDSVAGTSIRFDAMSGTFAATDVVDVMFVSTEKTLDKANDAEKSIEQAPLWARYQIDEIYDGTNLAAGTNYYPSSTGASMDGYKNLSFTSNLVDADGTITYTLEVTNDEDLTNATWMQVYGYDATLNATVNSLSVTNGTLNTAWDFDNLNCNAWRVKIVTSGSTNTIVIKARRTF